MNETIQPLLNLQYIEEEIISLKKKISRKRQELDEKKAAFLKRKEKINSYVEQQNEYRQNYKQEQENIGKYQTKINDIKIKLNTVKIKSQQEYDSLQEEITLLENQIEESKNKMSVLEEAIINIEIESDNLKKTIQETEEAFSKEVKQLDLEEDMNKQEIEKLTNNKQKILDSIEETLLEKYLRIFNSKGVPVLAEVNEGVCSGCYTVIPQERINQVRRGEQIMQCEFCNRLLFWNDGEENI